LTFVGAAGTVTGSKHLIETQGHHFFVDCGMFQGPSSVTALNMVALPIPAAQIEAVAITHGHIDHVGYLPKLVKDGFKGPIYCTPATAAIIGIVLEDAAHLQDHLQRHGHDPDAHALPPFYDIDDVAAAIRLIQTQALHAPFGVCGATLTYKNAGHILGSAFIEMTIEGHRVVFSGDLGRYGRPLLYDPEDLDQADSVVCESTYGDRNHPPDPLGDLHAALTAALDRGGPIVIPAFAVERTQDLLLAIGTLQGQDARIATIPVHVDSPMAIKVDAVFAEYRDAYKPVPNTPEMPFGCRNVTLHVTTDQSKALNDLTGPAIVISASGMASGGRILHHLQNQIPNPKATILFCGFQGPGTLGNLLVHGAKTIKIFGNELTVSAAIVNLAGYSAHADQNELLRWLGTLKNKPTLYAVHGDPKTVAVFDQVVHDKLGFTTVAGARGATVDL
jgi:metallo-beta-lactamase family protein